MNIFVLRREGKPPAVQFHLDELQSPHELRGLTGGEHPRAFERPAMGDAALNVIGVEPTITGQGGGELLHQPVGLFGKSATPGLALGQGTTGPLRNSDRFAGTRAGRLGLRHYRVDLFLR